MSKLNEDTIKALKIAGLKEPVTEGLNKQELKEYTLYGNRRAEIFVPCSVNVIASSPEAAGQEAAKYHHDAWEYDFDDIQVSRYDLTDDDVDINDVVHH